MSHLIKTWWKETFIYQIYPRSFKDSNGDGIGDLRGITQSLDYLKNLGVETLWLSPIYKSPNDDNGYDVSDYCDIMEDFGTMADFEEMLAEMKKKDLKLILDLVFNHSSDEHPWFVEARSSRNNRYRDYYIWNEGKDGNPPNNWVSFFEGSAWEYNPATEDYYLHLFTKKQPDLNWENPKVRQELYQVMRFWLDKGVNGFRFDVIPLISKKAGLPDIEYGDLPFLNMIKMYANGPKVQEFVQEMHKEVLQHYDCYTVGEGIGVFPEDAHLYMNPENPGLDTVYYFDHMFIDRDPLTFLPTQFHLPTLKKILNDWDKTLDGIGWNTFYLGNHDQPRLVSRFGNDKEYREVAAKLFATLLFTLKAIPFVYQGDELGMSNTPFYSPDEFNDVQARNQYAVFKAKGGTDEDYLRLQNQISRDHARTPFLWNTEANAGFTLGKPWLKVNPNYTEINAQKAQADPNSVWHYYQKMIQFRKENDVLMYGDFKDIDSQHPQLFVYERSLEDQKMLIVLNISAEIHSFTLKPENNYTLLISNYLEVGASNAQTLRPYEARVYHWV